jgi:hypothetical protein
VVDLADAPDQALSPVQVCHLGDGTRIQVITEKVGAILPIRTEYHGAVVIEPAGIGKVKVVGMPQIVGQSTDLPSTNVICIEKRRIPVHLAFAHVKLLFSASKM